MCKCANLVLILLNILTFGKVILEVIVESLDFIDIFNLEDAVTSQDATRKIRQIKECSLSNGEEYGTCQRWSQCESGQSAYNNKRIAPIYCQYDRLDPIVCCPATDNVRVDRNQRISDKMCRKTRENKLHTTTLGIENVIETVGGVRTEPGEFTHMAALGWKKNVQNGNNRNNYNFLCGGTLISDYFVLTAAHCARINGARPDIARVGGENLIYNDLDENIPIANVYLHPQYKRKQVYNDIALMKLEKSSNHIPACLWQTQEINYTDVIAIGYGDTVFGGSRSDDLLKVQLNIFSIEECQSFYQPRFRIENGIVDTQICAGDRKKIQDTCQGDSGGPLMVNVNYGSGIIPYILGVTSFGQSCAAGPPSVYIRISSYLDWIESIVWPN